MVVPEFFQQYHGTFKCHEIQKSVLDGGSMRGKHCMYRTQLSFWEEHLVCQHNNGPKWIWEGAVSRALG